ncbi:hypothetical protein MKW98_012969, partial [Papaver atlanticum]
RFSSIVIFARINLINSCISTTYSFLLLISIGEPYCLSRNNKISSVRQLPRHLLSIRQGILQLDVVLISMRLIKELKYGCCYNKHIELAVSVTEF